MADEFDGSLLTDADVGGFFLQGERPEPLRHLAAEVTRACIHEEFATIENVRAYIRQEYNADRMTERKKIKGMKALAVQYDMAVEKANAAGVPIPPKPVKPRVKQRVRRQLKILDLPLPEVSTRAEAKAKGAMYYWSGEPCRHEHRVVRYVSSGDCVVCAHRTKRKSAAKTATV